MAVLAGGSLCSNHVVVGLRTCRLMLRARGAGGCWRWQRQLRNRVRGCSARFARRWGQAADALARAACSRHWRLLAEVAAVTGAASSGGEALVWLGSHQGWAADTSACAACLRCWRCSSTSVRWRGGSSFHLARVGVRPLTCWLALHAHGPGPGAKWGGCAVALAGASRGRQRWHQLTGGGSGSRSAWVGSGSRSGCCCVSPSDAFSAQAADALA